MLTQEVGVVNQRSGDLLIYYWRKEHARFCDLRETTTSLIDTAGSWLTWNLTTQWTSGRLWPKENLLLVVLYPVV